MSILLESLNKEPTDQENQVPDVHASHFDDDMLGDEWLLRRIRIWQVLSFLLIVVLVISWVSLYSQLNQARSISAELIAENSALKSQLKKQSQVGITKSSNIQLENEAGDTAQGTNTDMQPEVPAPFIESTPADTHSQASNSIVSDESENNKLQYVPKKRQPRDAKAAVSKSSTSSRKTSSQTVPNDTSQGTILSKEELSSELLAQFPNIEINSFVVAENADDSFVILDGSFYKVNQVIAPNLVLREISKQYILVEFHTQLIKLPHN